MKSFETKALGLLECKLDADSGDYAIAPNDFINGSDFRFNTTNTAKGATTFAEAVGSTILKGNPNLPITGTTYQIGATTDTPNLRILFFVWNSLGADAIFCYDLRLDTVFTVLLASQVTGGLNFSKDRPIHSSYALNGCLYWVNGKQNQPRRLDIEAGIKMNHPTYVTTTLPYTAPLSASVISWIRRQPGLPPTEVKFAQTTPALTNNFTKDSAFQFAYRYIYRNFEISTLSALSTLANYNFPADAFNRIDTAIPLQERIDQDVIQVDLVVKILDTGQYFVIKSWLTSNTADAAAIAAHNAGTTPLSFSFYNDKLGVALDPTYDTKPYDTVPLYAFNCEAAKSRSFLCNYVAGYDTPTSTSLTLTPVGSDSGGGGGGAVTGLWFFFKFQSTPIGGGGTTTTSLYMLDISDIPDADHPGYYQASSLTVPPYPPTVPWGIVSFLGAGVFDVMNHFAAGQINTILQFTNEGASSVISGAPSNPALVNKQTFKSASPYQGSVTFYDNAGRKCGIVTNKNLQVSIDERTYSTTVFTQFIDWTLDNTNALIEIPDWAYYYSVNLSLNLRTRFFMDARAAAIKYATPDPSTVGNYLFTSTSYAPTNSGVAIDLSLLNGQGMGYTLNLNDLVKLYCSDGAIYTLSVIAQQGQWLILQLANIANIAAVGFKCLFELFTPYKPSIDEASYERAQLYPISNPGLSSRVYSVTAGAFNGDVYLLNRNDGTQDYLAEAMSPNDKFYKNWWTDAGRPNFIDTIGQQSKTSTITWSDPFINGSKVNGLSTFSALDTKDLSSSYGRISKLILTSKVQKTGTVMLAIGSSGETASIYLNENVITTTTGDSQIVQTSDVIGYVNTLKGSYGTVDPTSVINYKGNVYWFDRLNGKYVQYSDAGLFPISNYKMTRYWKLFSQAFQALTSAQIETLGSRPFVFSGIDPHNGELLVTVPRVLADPPKGYLADYTPQIPYPYDVWDGQSKTLVFKLDVNPNKWAAPFSFTPEGYSYLEDNSYSFKNGNIYLHNDPNSQCTYYGAAQVQPKIAVVANQTPKMPKTFEAINIQALSAPVQTLMRTFYPFEQGSDLIATDYKNLEGVWYATILRDRLTPDYQPDYDTAQIKGEVLRSTALYIQFTFNPADLVQLKILEFGYTASVGHVPLKQ